MTVIAYTFLAGRYHATPWGAHVNEGLVEWPPSPFRLLRALVATGFSRLGWTAIDGSARELLDLLAASAPSYALPQGTASHTRHYMPPFKGNTTKVIDAFLRFPAGSRLLVRFGPLPDASREVLRTLLRAQPYLGRAESWVEGELIEQAPLDTTWIEPSSQPPGPGYERVELLACDDRGAYETWRTAYVARELEIREVAERRKAEAKGKAFKALPLAERKKVEMRVPPSVIDALLQDTGSLRKEGWSQPPGTRWVSYFRPSGALVPRVSSPARSRSAAPAAPTTALLALSSDTSRSDVFPPMTDGVRRMEALHDALVKLSDIDGSPSACFIARANGVALRGHQHATLIPLALGHRKDRLDHVLVHSPMGLDDKARAALFRVRKTWAHDLPDLFLALAGVGAIDSFSKAVPHARASIAFRSATPFVPARFLKTKGNDRLAAQVQRELAFRGLPAARAVEVEISTGGWTDADGVVAGRRGGDLMVTSGDASVRPSARFRHFRRARASRPPPVSLGLSLRLVFDAPVRGPIVLGYGSHFGLGVFEPADQGLDAAS